jgi:CRISPR-associated exonuclease Cas4
MLYLSVFLIFIGLVLLWQARRRLATIGLPAGRVIYADNQKWARLEQALYDPELGITGKPDYLVEQGNWIIPVEVKTNRVTAAPYDSHIYQLAVYCLLVERLMGKRPPHGILNYTNRTYEIDYTTGLKSASLQIVDEIRKHEKRKEVHRSHEIPARCQGCGYYSICNEKLG